MKWNRLAVVAAMVVGMWPAGNALAACVLGIDLQGASPAYDFFSGSMTVQAYEVEVTHNAGDSCDFFVTFARGGAASYDRGMALASNTLSYQLFSQANLTGILKDLPDAQSVLEVLSGTISAQDTSPRILTYYLVIPADQVVPPGSYQDTVTVSVYEGTLGGSPVLADSQGLAVSTSVERDIQLSLPETGAPFDPDDRSQSLDFGALAQNESMGFDVMVRTNAGYTISLLSENQGRLKHRDLAAATNSTVDYTLRVDGVAANLSGSQPVQVAGDSGATTVSGVRHPTSVTIGSVAGKVAGIYEDTVTITAATIE